MNAFRVACCIVLLTSSVGAREQVVSVHIDVPLQTVTMPDGSEADFAVLAHVYQDHRARGDWVLALARGDVLEFEVISGIARYDARTEETSLMILLRAKLEAGNFGVAVATPDPSVPGCDIWDFMGIIPGDPAATFHADGAITPLRGKPGPKRRDRTRVTGLAVAPDQEVEVKKVTLDGFRQSFTSGFAARVRVLANYRANGFIRYEPEGDAPVEYHPLFGAVVPQSETGPGYIVILMTRTSPDDPFGLGDLVFGTVQADLDIPGCDIWDLMGGQVTIHHEAVGRLRIRPR